MIVASVMALVSYKLKQPMVIGYIIAGMIIGPYTPPFGLVLNLDVLNLFSEIGVMLLLFVVGMEFPIEKLRKIGKRAFVIATSEAFGTFAIGFVVTQSLNYSLSNSLFLALAISVTSTVIVMRMLEELGMVKEEASYVILGVAVIEDIIVISMLAILQSVSTSGHVIGTELAITIGTVIVFIAGVLFVGSKTIPKFINFVGRTNQHDVLVVTGALMDITQIPLFIIPAIVLILVSLGAKFFTVYLASKSQGYSTVTALRAGFGLSSSGGELALVVAKGGQTLGLPAISSYQ